MTQLPSNNNNGNYSNPVNNNNYNNDFIVSDYGNHGDNSNKNRTYFPSEVQMDVDKFSIEAKVIRDKKDQSWCSRITYNGSGTLRIQTPEVLITFDVAPYTYGNNNKNSREKYSISVSLDEKSDPNIRTLLKLIKDIDNCARTTFSKDENSKKCRFIESIKHSKESQFPPLIRLSMVTNKTIFKTAVKQNGHNVNPDITKVRQLLKKGTKVVVIMELGPMWCNEKQGICGNSWRALAINIIKEEPLFR